MRYYSLFVLLFLIVSCKKKKDETPPVDSCAQPVQQNFKALLHKDEGANTFLNLYDMSLNDDGDDWHTDRPIPCFYFKMMDTTHTVENDSSTLAGPIKNILLYPNPAWNGASMLLVDADVPMLMHMLFVREDGKATYRKKMYIGPSSARQEGLDSSFQSALSKFRQTIYLRLDSVAEGQERGYFRMYYYFSTKYNKRFGEGHGDLYIGQSMDTRYLH